ncbi:MAG: phosphonate ABC transporter substrate-binding protein [Thalassobaculales bacterium]
MTISRRALTGAAALLALGAGAASAQDWKSQYKELTFAVVPAENASGVTGRYGPLVEYWSKELGVPVKLRIANDYAAVIEGQRSGQIHIGYHGPASFARALKTGVKAEAFALDVNLDGTKGYYSVFYVKKDAPYQSIQDLKGKNLGLVDPNSTSGYNVPLFALDKMKIEPEKFFGKVLVTGSHENAVLALQQGTVDVAANWYNDENESNLLRMARKNMVKAEDFRIILKSDLIVNSPWTYLASLPADLKKAIRDSFLQVHVKAPEVFQKATDGKSLPWAETDNKAYDPIIELITFVDNLKKKSS